MLVKSVKGFGSLGVKVSNISYPFKQDEISELKKLLKEQLLLILPKCHYTVDQFYELSSLLGTICTYGLKVKVLLKGQAKLYCYVDKNGGLLYPGLVRVTAKKDSKGNYTGLAPGYNKRLNWHNDESERDMITTTNKFKSIKGKWVYERPMPEIIGFHGVKGTKGSVTQICQMVDRFQEESEENKSWLRKLIIRWGLVKGKEGIYQTNKDIPKHSNDTYKKKLALVTKAINNIEGLHFSPSQTVDIVNTSAQKKEFAELKRYIMKEYVKTKYIYSHTWKDGDILYIDQKTSIHRRVGVVKDYLSVEELRNRLLHHISIHIKKV